MFVELMPLLKQRTLLITVARVDERLKVNVIPVKAKEGEDAALPTTSATQDPQRNWTELGQHLAGYVDSYLALEAHWRKPLGDGRGGQSRAAEGKDRATDLKTRYRDQGGNQPLQRR